jgi:hypothetical protein
MIGRAAWAAAALGLCHGAAPACGESLGDGARRIGDPRYTVVYRPAPEPVPLGRHFVLDFVVCTAAGTAPPSQVRVDATMPEHKHGMNYRASVTARGDGHYRAEGLMFHMPGRWELQFDLRSEAGTVRLTQTLPLPQ